MKLKKSIGDNTYIGVEKGITLVALVITIIVLLILAGITISLTIGQRGILKRAEEAGKNYGEASKQEENELIKISNEMDSIIEGTVVPDLPSETNYTIVDGVPVPKGFEHVEGTKDTGFVIKDISVDSQGNPTKTNGNEFVWVPCTEDGKNGSIKYDRYAFSSQGWAYTQTKDEKTGEILVPAYVGYVFTEEMSNIEITSIKKYGGFYIGRYEVGVEGYDVEVKTSNTNNEKEWTGYTNGTAVVQEDKQVWNYITRDLAKKIAEEIYTNNMVTSRLCSSYAWDTTLQFIENRNEGYATNSTGGNYSRILKHTGMGSIAKNNIYDMGGNITEWTTEVCSSQIEPCTGRGGVYVNNPNDGPASYRCYTRQEYAYDHIGFRIALYIS